MFYDPLRTSVIDFVRGREDLARKLIRAIGEPSKRFAEDRLRMLRAVRFASTLVFEIESGDLVGDPGERLNEILMVSPERIRDELLKILVDAHRVRGFDLLDKSGLLAVILPEVEALKGCEQPEQFHPEGDVFVHTRMMLGLLERRSERIASAQLFCFMTSVSRRRDLSTRWINGFDLTDMTGSVPRWPSRC